MHRCVSKNVDSFFFSSRRRHTRLQGDWSSDVCSSDLWGPLWFPTAARGSFRPGPCSAGGPWCVRPRAAAIAWPGDRKSTRLNSSHLVISYAVFCLKKKKKIMSEHHQRDDNAHVISTPENFQVSAQSYGRLTVYGA